LACVSAAVAWWNAHRHGAVAHESGSRRWRAAAGICVAQRFYQKTASRRALRSIKRHCAKTRRRAA